MLAWIIGLACVCGLTCLASAMSKHQKELFEFAISANNELLLKCIGWAILLLSALASCTTKGITLGISLWFGALSLSALFVAIMITYFPKKVLWANVLVAVGFFGLIIFG